MVSIAFLAQSSSSFNEVCDKDGKCIEREAKRRVSPIIGKIVEEKPTGWTALMTAKEIVFLFPAFNML